MAQRSSVGERSAPSAWNPWPLTTALAVLLVYAACIRFQLWGLFAVPSLMPAFLDLHAVLSASDCHLQGYDVFRENPCDATFRPLGYSRAWLAVGALGLSRDDGSWLGFALAMTVGLAAVLAVHPGRPREAAITAAVLLSPAVMLGVERGNNDLVVFVMLLGAGAAAGARGRVREGLAFAVVWLAAWLKFYPLCALTLLGAGLRTRRHLGALALAAAVGVAGLAALILPDLESLSHTVPSPVRRWTFGARLLLIDLGWDHWAAVAAGAAAMAAAGVWWGRRLGPPPRGSSLGRRALFLGASAILIGCFFANTNYDYRCIFFLGTLPLLFDCLSLGRPGLRRLSGWLLAGTLLIVWAEMAVHGLMAAEGLREANFLVADRYRVPWLRVTEQLVTWLTLTGLAALSWTVLAAAPLWSSAAGVAQPRDRAPSGS